MTDTSAASTNTQTHRPGFTLLCAVWLLLALTFLAGCTATPTPPAPTASASPTRPEIVATRPARPTRPPRTPPATRGPRTRPTTPAPALGTPLAPPATVTVPAGDLTGEPIPLTDMGQQRYFGFEGGLYPEGSNEPPPEHAQEGLERAAAIEPLDVDGNPDPDGRAVLLSIGMSNTSMEFCRALGTNSPTDGVTCQEESFMGLAAQDPAVEHDDLIMVNGARGGQIADRWDSPDEENYDHIADNLLAPLGLSPQQVQVVWLKVTNVTEGAPPSLPDPQADAYRLAATMADVVRALKVRFPNLQQVFISSRIYAGYATRDINAEPYAYETGFAVKWLIEAQVRQMAAGGTRVDPLVGDLHYDRTAPWLAWGPYLWADGTNPRSDGLVWLPEDFGDDGTHPSVIGRGKVGALLLDFFKSSPYTACWFLVDPPEGACTGRTVPEPAVTPEPAGAPTATPERAGDGTGDVPLSAEARPLTEMGTATYQGFAGGLYPEGSNEPPPEHAAEGLARAQAIQPLDTQGNPDPNGKIVLLSVGMSNTVMEFCGEYVLPSRCEPYSFIAKALGDPDVNQRTLEIVNAARGSQVASRWDSPDEDVYDRARDGFLIPLGLDERQVQVVWLKVTDFLQGLPPLPADNAHAYALEATLGDIVRALKIRYPNLQQVFLSSRIYGGYALYDLSPEPYAYETGFAVKWLIEAQIAQMASGGEVVDPIAGDLNYNTVAPWLAWGPYLWADGANPRADGLVWLPEDFSTQDGTHPSDSGRAKVANLLLEFFKTSPFTRCWFLAAC